MTAAGGIAVLIELVGSGDVGESSYATYATYATYALASLARDDGDARAIVGAGGIAPLVELMRRSECPDDLKGI
eukprot:4246440-Pyramimonas_sp.AAC.1